METRLAKDKGKGILENLDFGMDGSSLVKASVVVCYLG